ncbi:MAG: hypothetical protein H6834_09425 [Planctomycetes bacterium]|nr:hypothetical protein [Planctomycetota bacterium]
MSMAAYIQHVEQLSDDELRSQAPRLAGITLKHTAELIAHISVIADKKAFRPEYTSLFMYCINELGLSEGETHVRTQVANVCRRHPELLDSLGANRMSLTVAGKLAPHLTMENASELIAACEGMTRRQVEEYLVQFKHGKEVTPGIRAVSLSHTVAELPKDEENHESTSEGSSAPSLPVPSLHRPVRHIEPVKPDVFNFRFAASGAFKNKLERLAEVVGVVDVTVWRWPNSSIWQSNTRWKRKPHSANSNGAGNVKPGRHPRNGLERCACNCFTSSGRGGDRDRDRTTGDSSEATLTVRVQRTSWCSSVRIIVVSSLRRTACGATSARGYRLITSCRTGGMVRRYSRTCVASAEFTTDGWRSRCMGESSCGPRSGRRVGGEPGLVVKFIWSMSS